MMESIDAADRIHIEGLEVMARVGVPDGERGTLQRLVFNMTIWPMAPLTTAALQDDVTRTVDYAVVCAETKRFVETRSDRLIETLADAVATRLLEWFPIKRISVELRKFILPEIKFVSVTVERIKSGASHNEQRSQRVI